VRFNDEIRPYLLQLRQNFTKPQLEQLLKLKSSHSYRIYWLLKEYGTFGQRTIDVEELKSLLNLQGRYKQFPLFRLRVLNRAQEELSKTDLPFEYELHCEGKNNKVVRIRFVFKPLLVLTEAEAQFLEGTWQQALKQLDMAPSSLVTIQSLIEQGKVTSDYVLFVVKDLQAKYKAGKVKSVAGAVFSAITKLHLMAEYQAQQQKRPNSVPSQLTKQREKLLTKLEDTRKALSLC
jgi:hypothetical protein